MAFTVLPAFYQTTWFRLLCFVIVAAFYGFFTGFVFAKLATHMQARLEERLEERERIARELHDTLLQGFVSAYMQLDVANDRLPVIASEAAGAACSRSDDAGKRRRTQCDPQPALATSASDGLEEILSAIRAEFPLQEQVDFRVIVEGKPHASTPCHSRRGLPHCPRSHHQRIPPRQGNQN